MAGWLGALYFLGWYGIAAFGEDRHYPFYMPFADGMVIVCGIAFLWLFVSWIRSLSGAESKRNAVLISILFFPAGFGAAICAYFVIDELAQNAKCLLLPEE